MYIEPNSTIRLISGVPLDNTYTNTLYFENAEQQAERFRAFPDYVEFTRNSYQRADKGRLRVNAAMDLFLYKCNYMMFRNATHTSKWYYAFVTGVTYINETTTEITYELDLMQTWFFNYQLKDSLVIREHSVTDEIGDNTLPEPIEINDIVTASNTVSRLSSDMSMVFFFSEDHEEDGFVPVFDLYGGLPNILSPVVMPCNNNDDILAIEDFIDGLQEKESRYRLDELVNVIYFPSELVPNIQPYAFRYFGRRVEAISMPQTFGDYTPKNKKLLTYPYNFLNIVCGSNNGLYRYEYFKVADKRFIPIAMVSSLSPSPEIMVAPIEYNGNERSVNKFNTDDFDWEVSFEDGFVISDFPFIALKSDTYKEWLITQANHVQNQAIASTVASGLTGAIGGAGLGSIKSLSKTLDKIGPGIVVGGGIVGGLVGAGVAALEGAMNYQITAKCAEVQPSQIVGTNTGGILSAIRAQDIVYQRKQIKKETAMVIDDFFNVFGYACNRVKIPARNVRPHWTFTKTDSCNLQGNAPSSDLAAIKSIYNKGITFWKNANEVGNYQLDNSPI